MSWFASVSSDSGPKLHPVHLAFGQEALFGPLLDEDTAWVATSSGFITETQIWYATTPTGGQIMCQVSSLNLLFVGKSGSDTLFLCPQLIHSSVG